MAVDRYATSSISWRCNTNNHSTWRSVSNQALLQLGVTYERLTCIAEIDQYLGCNDLSVAVFIRQYQNTFEQSLLDKMLQGRVIDLYQVHQFVVRPSDSSQNKHHMLK